VVPFKTTIPTTENARLCIAGVRANGTTRTHSQQSEGISAILSLAPTLTDRSLVDRLVQGQVGTTKPEFRIYHQCAVGHEANAERLT